MKDILLEHCLQAQEARLYDFVLASKVIPSFQVPTAGVNNKGQLFINPEFYEKVKEHIIGLLFHESLHVFFDHVNRKHEHPRVANVAQDVVINQLILDLGYTLPPNGCTYESLDIPRHLRTSEEVYEHLLQQQQQHQSGAPQQLTPEEWEKLKDEMEEDHTLPQDLSQEGKGGKEEEEQGSALKAIAGTIAGDLTYRREMQIRKDLESKLLQPHYRGIVNAIMKVMGGFLAPTFTRTYSRASRLEQKGVMLPASRALRPHPGISIYLDVSGSMAGENLETALNVLGELRPMLKAYNPSAIRYFTFNTQTYPLSQPPQEGGSLKVGGGTEFNSFHPTDINRDVVFIITDCEFSFDFLQNHDRKHLIILNIGGGQGGTQAQDIPHSSTFLL